MFDKKLVPIPYRLGQGNMSPPPHLDWVNDYGEKRIPELREGTQSLIRTIAELKDTPLPEGVVVKNATLWVDTHAKNQAWQRALDGSAKANVATSTALCFEGVRRNRDQRPDTDPFASFDASEALKPPQYLLGTGEAVGWVGDIGLLACESERHLGWQTKPGQIDRRTWAALMGWSFAQIELDMDLPPFDTVDLEAIATWLVAGTLVMAQQAVVLAGYTDARKRAGTS